MAFFGPTQEARSAFLNKNIKQISPSRREEDYVQGLPRSIGQGKQRIGEKALLCFGAFCQDMLGLKKCVSD